MGTLTIRNLDDRVIEKLKAAAKANHRSLEGEVRYALTQRTQSHGSVRGFRERTGKLLSLTAGREQTDSVELLREDRER